jgi:metal-dependent amidase/aminoacylase/carboxypeptidase family protein
VSVVLDVCGNTRLRSRATENSPKQGTKAMVEDGLCERIVPVPDVILGQHVVSLRTGVVAIRSGPALTAADSFNVTVFGKGGHAGTPQHCIDPILLVSHFSFVPGGDFLLHNRFL